MRHSIPHCLGTCDVGQLWMVFYVTRKFRIFTFLGKAILGYRFPLVLTS